MKSLNKIQMWASQTTLVWETVEQEGISWVKGKYIDKKYGEVAWIFKTAYASFMHSMEQKIPRPDEAEYPIWLYQDPSWTSANEERDLRCLLIPREEVLLFDLRKWSQVLNLELVGTEEERAAFKRELNVQGIRDSLDIFRTSYYPLLKRRIMKSWESIFDIEETEERYLQGAVWCLKKEWIQRKM